MKIEELKQGQAVWVKGFVDLSVFGGCGGFINFYNQDGNHCGHISRNNVREMKEEDVQIDQLEQQKPVVAQVAIDYYNEYKNVLSSFDEWFCGFYDDKFDEEFEKAEELRIWLYDNDNKINLQHELALATLIVNGPDAVTVEKEKLYTVEIPNPNAKGHNKIYLCKADNTGKVYLCKGNFNPRKNKNLWLTEQEIRKDFDWAWQWKKEVTE